MKKCAFWMVLLACLACLASCANAAESDQPVETPPVETEAACSLTVSDVTVYGGYYAEIRPVLEGIDREIVYSFEDDAITIDGNRVTARFDGFKKVKVTAAAGKCTASFTVQILPSSEINEKGYREALDRRVEAYRECSFGEPLTLFLGDSFFDTEHFWTDFDVRFAGKNAFSFGVSATQARHWIWYSQLLYALSPDRVVIHIGTNDIFDVMNPTATVTELIETLLSDWHENVPNAELYWFTIEPRTDQTTGKAAKVAAVNAAITAWAEDRAWLCVIDSNTVFAADPSLYREGDTVHPACPAGYDALMDAAYLAGLHIE